MGSTKSTSLIDDVEDTILPALNADQASGLVQNLLKRLRRALYLRGRIDAIDQNPTKATIFTIGLTESERMKHNKQAARDLQKQVDAELSEVNTLLSRYRWKASIIAFPNLHGGPTITPVPEILTTGITAHRELDEAGAIEGLLVLMSVGPGILARFRSCQVCARWFFAHSGKKKHCTRNCYRKFRRTLPTVKAEHARYMRDSYRPRKVDERLKPIIRKAQEDQARELRRRNARKNRPS